MKYHKSIYKTLIILIVLIIQAQPSLSLESFLELRPEGYVFGDYQNVFDAYTPDATSMVWFCVYKNTTKYPVSVSIINASAAWPNTVIGSDSLMTIADGDIVYLTYTNLNAAVSFQIASGSLTIKAIN